ncbi:hypothetical protein AK812_SmicGene37411 [Symbiodinium microadriaticum]|uniref:Uncharacterized protein n=1 Tax=Symbiodinium microadriaticum TaxID=2951 RepID=A0A1Q9CGD1_SYMMI|nr:hypothetical protein AK812_SmicGene37411 [Symbiodinium microadriaticum]
MSFGESTAVFKARVKEIGISDESFANLEKEGLTTMATFAFCCHFNPSAADEKPLTELVARVLVVEPSLKEMSCFRRLFAEAYATVASDIKAQVEATEDSSIKKLAPADRAERLREQQARLSGLDLKGNLEPGDSLIDRAVAIYESDRLQYIEWQHCVSRQHELLTGLKKDASLTLDGTGGLKISSKPNVVPCDVSSDMLVRYALVRRGLALEQANILDYKLHDELLEKYMFFRLTDPPPGYARVSLKQIEQADRQFILLMAEQTRNGVRVKAGGTRPCDDSFRRVFESTEFLSMLHPRPLAAGAANRETPTGDEPPLKRLRPPGRGQGRGRNGKGSSKGSQNARVPAELLAWGLPQQEDVIVTMVRGGVTAIRDNTKRTPSVHEGVAWQGFVLDCANQVLRFVLESRRVAMVFAAPPCGTCSAARHFRPGPPVLRTLAHPWGVPWASAKDFVKLKAANAIYKHLCAFIEDCESRSIPWCIENPTNSSFWSLPCLAFPLAHGFFANCQACAFGSNRDKKTSFLCSSSSINRMALLCPGCKSHEAWGANDAGGFATAEEAAYPKAMCQALCDVFELRSCENFVAEARRLYHPFDSLAQLPDYLIKSLFEQLTKSPAELCKLRLLRLQRWRKRATELAGAESDYQKEMPPSVRDILSSKRTALLEEMANEIQWPDKSLFSEMRQGFRLVGCLNPSGIFREGGYIASISEEDLMAQSGDIRAKLLSRVANDSADENSEELYATTLEEATAKGWLEGPFSPQQISERFGSWLPVRRFAVVQKGRLRPIDDFKENMLNQACSTSERIVLHALDHLLWSLTVLCHFYRCRGAVDFVLSSQGMFMLIGQRCDAL